MQQQINLRNQSQAHVVCWTQGLGLLDIKPAFSTLFDSLNLFVNEKPKRQKTLVFVDYS